MIGVEGRQLVKASKTDVKIPKAPMHLSMHFHCIENYYNSQLRGHTLSWRLESHGKAHSSPER